MNSGLAAADYIILAGFFVVLLAIGFFYAGRMNTLRDFFSGGRHVPWWLAGISLYMTTFSAFTFVSYSALAYQYGFVAIAIWWFSVPGCLISARFLASRWRRAATTSPVEYLETRFGPALRQCFSWFGVPLIVLDDALKLFVIGTMITASLGLADGSSTMWAIGICGLIMVSYTLLGGLWAVMITDFIQFVVMGIAVIVLLPLAWHRAGGAAGVTEHLPANFSDITVEAYTWPWLISFAVILALTFATKWPYVQRYYAARSDQEARWVGYLVAALTVVSPPLLFFPAIAARSFMPDVADANQVYAMICRELLPVGMMGVMLAAMFSATMSMLSSDYNSVASVVTNDVIKRLFMKTASDKALVLTARLATLGIGLVAMVLAMAFARADTLQDLVKYMAQLFAVLLPPVALPMIAGLLTRRASNAGALLGFALGAVCGIGAYIAGGSADLAYLRTIPYLTWITTIPTALGLLIGSVMWPDSSRRREEIDAFLHGLDSTVEIKGDLVSGGEAAVALRIIGMTMALLGAVLAAGVLFTVGFSAGVVSIGVGAAMLAGGAAAVFAARVMQRAAGEKS